MTEEEIKAELEKLRAENERLKEEAVILAADKYPISRKPQELTDKVRAEYRQRNRQQRVADRHTQTTKADMDLATAAKIQNLREENEKLRKKRK